MSYKHVSSSWHKRSKSDSENEGRRDKLDSAPQSFSLLVWDMGLAEGVCSIKNRPSLGNKVQRSLKREIHQLEKHLKDQFEVRHALEKALGYRTSSLCSSNNMPKTTQELVREISVLEFEVTYLEQYLLSLYREAFLQQTRSPALPPTEETTERFSCSQSTILDSESKLLDSIHSDQLTLPRKSVTNSSNESEKKPTLHRIHRRPSSLVQHSSFSSRISPSMENLDMSTQEFYSQPLSHSKEDASGVISLADRLGAKISDLVHKTSINLSEEMVRCMCAIYYKIAYSTRTEHGLISFSSSSLSSASVYSSSHFGGTLSPCCRRDSTLDGRLENSFDVEGLKDCFGTNSGLFEVTSFSSENQNRPEVEKMLQQYKSLVRCLVSVNPRSMNDVEKMAFWINIYNSMMMHQFVEHGLPQNNLKRALIYSKASYVIGGCSVSLEMIQSSILRCRTHRHGQWIRAMLLNRTKLWPGDNCRALAIERNEPLLHFAMCSGSPSDPVLRVYSPKKLYQQLEGAKDEYIRSWVGFQKDRKLVLPKIIDYFARDKGLDKESLVDMIELYVPDTLQAAMKRSKKLGSRKTIEWSPHSFGFRYLIPRECAASFMEDFNVIP